MTRRDILETSRMARAAVLYAEKGYRVFPCEPCGKRPICKHGVKDATSDIALIKAWWTKKPDANIGIATGASLLVVDIDGERGEESLSILEEEHGELPPTPQQRTGKGRHLLFRVEGEVRNTAQRLGKNIDTRGDGGYIIAAPSMHANGTRYEWHAEQRPSRMDPADAPAWLIEAMTRPKISEQAAPAAPVAPRRTGGSSNVDKYIDAAVNAEISKVATCGQGSRNDTLFRAAAALGGFVGAGALSQSFVESALSEAAASCGLPKDEAAKTIASGIKTGMESPRTLPEEKVPIVGQVGQVGKVAQAERAAAPIKRSVKIVTKDGETVEDPDEHFFAESVWIGDRAPHDFVLTSEGGKKKTSIHNIILHLTYEKALAGLFGEREGTGAIYITRAAPWSEDGESFPRLANAADFTELCAFLELRGLGPTPERCHQTVVAVARKNPINPARDNIEALEWDRTERLDHWLVDALGADDTPFNRQAGAKWLISGVARVYQPGCKADATLVLEGPQGARKSTALSVIASVLGEDAFTDRVSDLGGKDSAIELRGRTIVELAELDAFRKSQISTIKAFLTRQYDLIRLPYERQITKLDRACIFAGTVNPGGAGWLSDETGGRRFWPVTIGDVNIEMLQDWVKQLWAEAAHRYREGEEWWLTDDVVIREQQQAVEQRYNEDPWADMINEWIGTRQFVRTREVLEAIGVPKERMDRLASNRVVAHLRRIGFDSHVIREDHGTVKGWKRSVDDDNE